MGQQQLALLLLGVLIVGTVIAVSIGQFGSNNIKSNKEGIAASLRALAANASRYRQKRATHSGEKGSFSGFTVPANLAEDDYGRYYLRGIPDTVQVTIAAKSSFDSVWTAILTLDSSGASSITYNGW